MITPDFSAVIANLFISLISCAMSTIKSFLQALVNKMSPIAPSVSAGQNTGILFFQAQQYMLSLLFIFSPIFDIILLGDHIYPFYFCILYNCAKKGSKKFQSFIQLQLVTRMFPIRQCPLILFCLSSILNSPNLKLSIHFIISSYIPPADVTIQSTILCSTKYLMVSLIPEETIFDVQPKKMRVLILALYLGSLVSQSSLSLSGYSDNLQEIIRFMILIAFAKFVACSPVVEQAQNMAEQSTPLLKSYPLIGAVQSF